MRQVRNKLTKGVDNLVVVEHLGLVDGVDGVELVLPDRVLLLLPQVELLLPVLAVDPHGQHDHQDEKTSNHAAHNGVDVVP